jgi:hypothetical protein
MNPPPPIEHAVRGYRTAPRTERAAFGMLTGFSLTVGTSRAINYVRERRRPAPRARSRGRKIWQTASQDQARVHHFVPGIAIAVITGAAAILTRTDRAETWLSAPFGVGVGLTIDELALLLQRDNPYWGSEQASLIQAAITALASAGLTARFYFEGRAAGGRRSAPAAVA